MNISKRIIISGMLIASLRAYASELTPLVHEHLSADTAKLVEQYVFDGTITLNPEYAINWLKWSTFGLHYKQIEKLCSIFAHQYKAQAARALELLSVDPDSASIILDYHTLDYSDQDIRGRTQYAPIIYSIPAEHIPKDALVPAIPQIYISGKKVGDRVMITDAQGKQYDFKLAEERIANMARIGNWAHLGQALIARGFIGEHAQMERFMENIPYFAFNRERILRLQQQDPDQLTDSQKRTLKCWDDNIAAVVTGKIEP